MAQDGCIYCSCMNLQVAEMPVLQDGGFLTVAEVAAYLRVSVRTVDALMAQGSGPKCFRVGRQRRWQPEEVEAWIAEQARAKARLPDID